jgi:cbb3-type cytochrome oxidase subunit 3
MVIGILIWVGIIALCAVAWAYRRRRPPKRTAQQVWDDADPEYKKKSRPPLPWDIGSGP